MAHRYKLNGIEVPGATTVARKTITANSMFGFHAKQGRLLEKGEISHLQENMERSREILSLVLDMIEWYFREHKPCMDVGDSELSDDDKAMASIAFKAAAEFVDSRNMEVVHQQIHLIHKDHQFGGCPHMIVQEGGKTSIIEWHTGSGLYPVSLLKLAAYSILCEDGLLCNDSGSAKKDGPVMNMNIDNVYAVRLTKSNKAKTEIMCWEASKIGAVREQFLSLLDTWKRDKEVFSLFKEGKV